MKQLYVCEKCGGTFDDWDSAYNCEKSHLEPYQGYAPEAESRMTYRKGSIHPDMIVVPFRTWDEDGNPAWQYSWYKKASDFGHKELTEITAEREAREQKEEEDHERWRAEREARKAKEEAEAVGA